MSSESVRSPGPRSDDQANRVLLSPRRRSLIRQAPVKNGLRSDDGMPIEAWSLPCTDLPKITHHVTNMIVNGSWDDDEGSSDDEDGGCKSHAFRSRHFPCAI